MKRNGEHEDAENDADGVEDAKLRDQSPKRDLQAELRLIDYNQRQNISCKYPCTCCLHFLNLPVWANFYGLTDLSR